MNDESKNATFIEGQEVWVRATYVGKAFHHDESSVKIETPGLVEKTSYIDVKDKDICFTEPNRTRKFKKGDKVKRREGLLYGRNLDNWHPLLPHGETLIVKTDEDCNGEVGIFYGGITRYVSFFVLDLIEPAPEPRYFIDNEIEYSYIINYGTPTDYEFVAKLDIEHFTFEDAEEFCEKLNKK